MLENCPQLILQVCALTKDEEWLLRTIGPADNLCENSALAVTTSDVIRLISLIFTIVALPLALCADEEAGRYASKVSYDLVKEIRVCRVIPINLQLMVMYLGFLFAIVSRITLVALLYVFCTKKKLTLKPWKIHEFPNLVTPLCVEAHHMVMFLIYLINQRVAETNKSLVIIEKLRRLNMIVSFFFFSFSEVFLTLLQFPQRYRRAIRSRVKELDKGDERYRAFYLLYLFNLLEFIAVILIFSQSTTEEEELEVLTHDRIMRFAYLSIAGYVLSAVFFMFYHSPLLHPDSLKERAAYKTSDFTIFGKTPYCEKTFSTKCKTLNACAMRKEQEGGLLDKPPETQQTDSTI